MVMHIFYVFPPPLQCIVMTIKVTHFRIKVPLTTMIAVMTTFVVVKEAVLVLRMWRNS